MQQIIFDKMFSIILYSHISILIIYVIKIDELAKKKYCIMKYRNILLIIEIRNK